MKLKGSTNRVEILGGGEETSFTIAMNGKAFRVLSDNLYQNKIGSIVREISCNALDAHVMAGKPAEPFVIHIPDMYEPWFSVQDYGTGLTPDAIKTVFTKYFESTKDGSNEAVGAFGLGAKTPFSYTDQFTVTSVTGGVKRVYNAYITESDIPAIVEMDSSPTTEQNGVEIRMSAKREDYTRFAKEIATQLRFFKVKPKILNYPNFCFDNVSDNLVIDSRNVAISSDNASYNTAWAHVIQGSVGYPLDINQLSGKISADNSRLLSTLNGSQVRFYFTIGEIGVTASREGIEYNKHTIASIDRKLNMVRLELTKYINDQLVDKKTPYEKAEFLNSSSAISKLARGSDVVIPGVKTGNSGYYYFDFEDLLLDPKNKNQYGNALSLGKVKRWNPGKLVRDNGDSQITPLPKTSAIIVLRDTNSKPNIRAKHYLSTLGQNNFLLEIELDDIDGYTKDFIEKLTKAVGDNPSIIKRLSDIEPPVRVSTATGDKVRNSYTRPTCYMYTNESNGTNIRTWERTFDPLDEWEDDTAYIVIDDMQPILPDADAAILINKFNSYNNFNKSCLSLIAIRESDLKKIEGMDCFKPLKDYIDSAITRLEKNTKLKIQWRHAAIGELINSQINSSISDNEKLIEALKAIAPKSIPTRMILLAKRLDDKMDANDAKLSHIANFLSWEVDTIQEKYRKRVETCYKAMLERFQILKCYGDWQIRNNISVDHVAKYVSVM